MLNKVLLIGNVGRDPEVRYLDGNNPAASSNAKVATFTLATTERYKDRSGEQKENTEWHNIVAWRNLADLSERFIKKGTQIYVEGRLRTRSWTDQTGAKRYTTEILADNIQLLGRKSDNPGAQQGGYTAPAQGGYGQPQYQQAAPAYQPAAPSYQAPAPSYQQPVQPQPQQAYQQPAPQVQEPINLGIGEDGPDDDLPF